IWLSSSALPAISLCKTSELNDLRFLLSLYELFHMGRRVFVVHLFSHVVDPRCFSRLHPCVTLQQCFRIDHVPDGGELQFRVGLCHLCYSCQFCFHLFSASVFG